MNKQAQLEAILFSEGGEMPVKAVRDALGLQQDELAMLVSAYNEQGRGMVLVIDDKKILMRVSQEHAPLVETLRKEESNQALSKASLEVLSLVLYSEGSSLSASEIEHIRGVNSGYTLRQLTIRGLLSKVRSGMSYQYAPTAELLSFLGVTHAGALPGMAEVQQQLKIFKESQNNNAKD